MHPVAKNLHLSPHGIQSAAFHSLGRQPGFHIGQPGVELMEQQGQDDKKDQKAEYDRTLKSGLNGRQAPSGQLSPPGRCG
jgi:hypothetical protein